MKSTPKSIFDSPMALLVKLLDELTQEEKEIVVAYLNELIEQETAPTVS
jgi:hypothetical protein